jgi:hypothetical protein
MVELREETARFLTRTRIRAWLSLARNSGTDDHSQHATAIERWDNEGGASSQITKQKG